MRAEYSKEKPMNKVKKSKTSLEKKKEDKETPIEKKTVHCKHCFEKSPDYPNRWSSPKHTDDTCWMLHPEKRPASFSQRRVNNVTVEEAEESTDADLVADAIRQVGYNGIEMPLVNKKVTGGEVKSEKPSVHTMKKTTGGEIKSDNIKTKEEKKSEKKEKQRKRRQQEKVNKDKQWKTLLEKQINDKLDSVKVSEVMGDAHKVADSTRLEKFTQ